MDLAVKRQGQRTLRALTTSSLCRKDSTATDINLRGSLTTERITPTEHTQVKVSHVDTKIEVLREILGAVLLEAPRNKICPPGRGGKPWF